MQVSLSKAAREYMEKKGLRDILVDAQVFSSWCGSRIEQVVRPLETSEVERFESMGYKGVESEMGKVLMADQYYPTSANAHIQFDLDNFFGFKSLTMQVAEA